LEIEPVHVFSDIGWQIESLAFANHSRWLAAGKLDGMLTIFDLQSLAVIESVSRLSELSQVDCLAFSADDGHLFAGGSTGAIQVRTVDSSGRSGPTSTLVRHARAVQVLTPSSASDFLLSGAADGTLTWQTYGRDANHSNSLKAFDRKVLAARLPSDGFEAMATDGRQLRHFDLRNAKETRALMLAHAAAQAADFSADGTRLAVSSRSEIRVLDTASGHEVQTLARDTHEMHWTVRFHPNGRWLISGGRGRAWIWDVETGRCLATVELNCPFYIQVLAVSNDGELLAITPSAAGQALTIVRLSLDVGVHDSSCPGLGSDALAR
jgi:WD40 repeat protein